MQKHEKVCAKVFATKRKAFDVKAARAATDATGKGLEEDPYSGGGRGGFPGSKKKPMQKSAAAQEAKPKPKGAIPKWKLQSMQFRQAVGPVQQNNGGGGGGGASNFNPS